MIKSLLKRIGLPIIHRFKRACVKWPYLSNIYFCFDRDFEREHVSVLAGRLHYGDGINGASSDSHRYRLRRNTHRIEKGLISRPRRSIFATGYIEETVSSFLVLADEEIQRGQIADSTKWAKDVLDQYFAVVNIDEKPEIAKLQERYLNYCKSHEAELEGKKQNDKKAPYNRDRNPLAISVEDLKQLAIRRRSVRWYAETPVPRPCIDQALEIAGFSPSACNRQPYEFRVFDDPALVKKLAAIPMGTSGFNHQFPVFVVIVGDLSAYPFNRDRHVIYIDASLAAMAFQFALECQGIASCSINWPDIKSKEHEMSQAIGLKSWERVVMCLSLGYPDHEGLVPYSQKKELDRIRSYNQT